MKQKSCWRLIRDGRESRDGILNFTINHKCNNIVKNGQVKNRKLCDSGSNSNY